MAGWGFVLNKPQVRELPLLSRLTGFFLPPLDYENLVRHLMASRPATCL